MKRYFAKTNGYNGVLFVDENDMCYFFEETCFDKLDSFEDAQNADYEGIAGCETVEDILHALGKSSREHVFPFNEDEWSNITEF